jgi:hypothetical protein
VVESGGYFLMVCPTILPEQLSKELTFQGVSGKPFQIINETALPKIDVNMRYADGANNTRKSFTSAYPFRGQYRTDPHSPR